MFQRWKKRYIARNWERTNKKTHHFYRKTYTFTDSLSSVPMRSLRLFFLSLVHIPDEVYHRMFTLMQKWIGQIERGIRLQQMVNGDCFVLAGILTRNWYFASNGRLSTQSMAIIQSKSMMCIWGLHMQHTWTRPIHPALNSPFTWSAMQANEMKTHAAHLFAEFNGTNVFSMIFLLQMQHHLNHITK